MVWLWDLFKYTAYSAVFNKYLLFSCSSCSCLCKMPICSSVEDFKSENFVSYNNHKYNSTTLAFTTRTTSALNSKLKVF